MIKEVKLSPRKRKRRVSDSELKHFDCQYCGKIRLPCYNYNGRALCFTCSELLSYGITEEQIKKRNGVK